MIRVTNDWYDSYPEFDEDREILSSRGLPQVNEFDELSAVIYEDIIRQVTTGQGIYFGYECKSFPDNKILEISGSIHYRTSEENKKYRNNKRKRDIISNLKALGVEIDNLEELLTKK